MGIHSSDKAVSTIWRPFWYLLEEITQDKQELWVLDKVKKAADDGYQAEFTALFGEIDTNRKYHSKQASYFPAKQDKRDSLTTYSTVNNAITN